MYKLIVVVLTAVSLTACRGREREYPGPYGDKVAKAVPEIERATGLKFKESPTIETRSKEQVKQFVLSQFTDEKAKRQLAGMEAVYKQLGLLPDTLQLQPFLVRLLEEQIAGYYDPKTKVLYVVDGAPSEIIGITVTHELVHALQDQYINLDSIQNIEDNNDRATAAQAVFEGQAVFEQLVTMLGERRAALNLPAGWDIVRENIRQNRSSMPIFASAPLIIQESLIFPYLSGAEFIKNFKGIRKGDTLYKDIPVSTEQILHRSAYFDKRDNPTDVRLIVPGGTKVVYENTLGEFETRLFLYQHLKNQDDAVRGAAGWDGDRYMVLETPAGRGIVWATVWDSAVDAAEFSSMLTQVSEARNLQATRSVKITGGEVSGRPVVLYVDVPKNADPNYINRGSIITLSGIKLSSDE